MQREGTRAGAQLFYLTATLPNPLPKGEREPFETLSLKSEKNLKTLPFRRREHALASGYLFFLCGSNCTIPLRLLLEFTINFV